MKQCARMRQPAGRHNSFRHACAACSCSGVLQLLKLPSLNGLAPPVPETTSFIIRHRRRRLAIQVILRLQVKAYRHLIAGAKQDVPPHTALCEFQRVLHCTGSIVQRASYKCFASCAQAAGCIIKVPALLCCCCCDVAFRALNSTQGSL